MKLPKCALSVTLGAAMLAIPTAAIAEPVEKCGVIAGSDPDHQTFQLVPGLSVLRQTNVGSFSVDAPPGQKVGAIMCGRADIVPALNDYKVVLAGYPLFLSGDGDAMVILEIVDGRLQVRTTGISDPALLERIQSRVNEMQTAVQAQP
jgi:hypothetical protein